MIRIVYLPAFISSFNYQQKDHVFVVNGVTGAYNGERPPYGLGKFGDYYKGVGNFVGTVWGSNQGEKPQVISGEALSKLDSVTIYNPSNFFFIFPRSDSYLISQSWGILQIKNKGRFAIQIWPQKRCGSQRGKVYDLKPDETLTASFVGHWILEITYGSSDDLELIDVKTSGGSKKYDVLGMLKNDTY